jgi:hypothetical protein
VPGTFAAAPSGDCIGLSFSRASSRSSSVALSQVSVHTIIYQKTGEKETGTFGMVREKTAIFRQLNKFYSHEGKTPIWPKTPQKQAQNGPRYFHWYFIRTLSTRNLD